MLSINDVKKLSHYKTLSLSFPERIKISYEVKKNDNVMIYCDTGYPGKKASPKMGKTFYEFFKKNGNNVSLIVNKASPKIRFAPDKINNAFFSLGKNDLFISLSSDGALYFHKNGERVFTKKLLKSKKVKFVATNGLGALKDSKIKLFLRAFNHNQKTVDIYGEKIKNMMQKSNKVRITCPEGSDFSLKLGKRKVINNGGDWRKHSTNYPIGEVYTAPLEKSANGTLYIKSSKVLGETLLNRKPKKYVFENGLLVDTSIKKLKTALKDLQKFNKKKGFKNWKTAPYTIAEFAIGTNERAQLIGLMINDEKVFGTCHVAIGANLHFGGKTKCNGHSDHVVENPTILFDDKVILKDGKLQI